MCRVQGAAVVGTQEVGSFYAHTAGISAVDTGELHIYTYYYVFFPPLACFWILNRIEPWLLSRPLLLRCPNLT